MPRNSPCRVWHRKTRSRSSTRPVSSTHCLSHLEQVIIEKAQGNPFFLEELTRAVIEHGDLQADVVVPDTIQGVLSARIDRLPEAHKRLLQTASVLGREFAPRLFQAIWEGTRATGTAAAGPEAAGISL